MHPRVRALDELRSGYLKAHGVPQRAEDLDAHRLRNSKRVSVFRNFLLSKLGEKH